MNFYEHHIGDYAEATAHLTLLEDAVYGRLLRKCYATEKPIPTDLKRVQRLVGARTPEEIEAVQIVLDEFFVLHEDGYHNARCDREIAAFNEGQPERDLKKRNEANRLKRHRDERAQLFQVLTDAGEHADWNIKMADLRELVQRVALGKMPAPIGSSGAKPATPPATAPATPATATQSPLPITQYPVSVSAGERAGEQTGPSGPTHAGVDFEQPGAGPDTGPGSGGGQTVAQAMRVAGLLDVSATHPKFQALLAAGLSPQELTDAALYAAKKGQGFAYALARAEGRRRDAAQLSALPDAPAPASADPDSRAAITADALRLGVGPWRQVDTAGRTVTWAAYARRVQAARVAERAASGSVGVAA